MGNEIPRTTSDKLRRRDEGRCIVCGARATERMHRVRRREGGHELSNLALGCSTCHRMCHDNPQWAMDKGLILSAVAKVDPAQEPLWSWRGWVLLDDDGGIEVVAPRYTAQKPQTAL